MDENELNEKKKIKKEEEDEEEEEEDEVWMDVVVQRTLVFVVFFRAY